MIMETYWGLEIRDWLTIVAVIAGPILAVQAQRIVESIKDTRERRLRIFKSLMSTRAEPASRKHVHALNLIDIEFYGRMYCGTRWQSRSEKAVTSAWKIYHAHLYDKNHSNPHIDLWTKTREQLFVKMLYEMSQSLGYDFDEVQLSHEFYKPQVSVHIEELQFDVLVRLANILNNQNSLSVTIVEPPKTASTEISNLLQESSQKTTITHA